MGDRSVGFWGCVLYVYYLGILLGFWVNAGDDYIRVVSGGILSGRGFTVE